jgi:LysM repeat protein
MRFYEFEIVEAPGDDLQQKYNALLASLKKAGKDEGFFGRNSRRQENAELLAKFAQENGLSGMYDPETGDYVYSEENPDTGEVEVKTATNASMDSAKDLAGKGLLPDVVKQRFTDQLASATSNYKVGGVELPVGKNPELEKDMQDIFQADAKAKEQQEKSKVQTPNTQQFVNPDDADDADAKDSGTPEPPAPAIPNLREPEEKPSAPAASKPAATKPKPAATKPKPAASKPDSKSATKPKPDSKKAITTPALAAAARSKVSYNDLAKASGIDDPNKISVGQEIKLPGGGTYKVKKGDTLSGIAKNYNSGSIGQPAPAPAPSTPPVILPPPPGTIPPAQGGAPTPSGGNQPGGVGPDGKPAKPGPTPPKNDEKLSFLQRVKQRVGNMFDDVEATTMVESAIKMYAEGKVSRDFAVKVIKESKKMQGKH